MRFKILPVQISQAGISSPQSNLLGVEELSKVSHRISTYTTNSWRSRKFQLSKLANPTRYKQLWLYFACICEGGIEEK